MKIDKSRVRKSTLEVPLECQQLIERLQQCSRTELLEELSRIHSWTFGKCELLHWAQVLDIFDKILGEAAERSEDNKWILKCDTYNDQDFQLLICILRFTSLLIEHSFSRHLYNSMEHLLVLLESNDMSVVLEVLNLLYMFSKRSNFITRLKPEEKTCLLLRLQYLAESWGGKENGFGLADCCNAEKEIPASATTLHVEFHQEEDVALKKDSKTSDLRVIKPNLQIIHIEHVDKLHKTPAEIMKSLVSLYYVPPEKEIWLFTHVRLATHFADYHNRLKSVQARLQALSVMVYSNAIQDSYSILYNGILEELVEVVELQDPQLSDIKCAALRTLTAIIHLDRNPHIPNRRPTSRLNNIIDVTGASQYHGFLPVLVRNCISSLTNQIDFGQSAFKKMKLQDEVTVSLDESCGATSLNPTETEIQESEDLDSILMEYDLDTNQPTTNVATTATNTCLMDSKFPVSLTTALFSFLYHLASYEAGGEALVSCGMMESLLQIINWQGFELDHITFVTRAVRVIDLITNIDMTAFQMHGGLHSFISRLDIEVNFCKRDQLYQIKSKMSDQTFEEHVASVSSRDNGNTASSADLEYIAENAGKTCLPQRAALLKSMLNFLKKAFQDTTFAESIRNLMEGTLPNSLKNIIANAEYYGPSLFLLATDVVTVYVYQEPSLLSTLQDNGLTDVVLHSLLVKEVPATREVLGSLPNVFSALCLNNRGLETFAKCKPFEKLFSILLSPNYLPAMRRRRSSEVTADTACNLGNAMDELMRHQPSLRQDATLAILNLLEELVTLGTDPKYICWRPHNKSEVSPSSNTRPATSAEGSSDEEEDDEDETSTSSQNVQTENQAQTNSERQPIALIDYILNTMKFIDAILSNNSTDDHCREFVENGGLIPLLKILGLPNLPVDCPVSNPAQAVATVCKSILNLAHEPFLFSQGLSQLAEVLENLKPLCAKQEIPGGSKLLLELANASDIETAFSSAALTPLLHAMNAVHGYVIMFVHICRTGQTEIRNLSLQHWGSDNGLKVLKGLADLYTSLVWESTLLLAYCSDDLLPSDCDFTREDIEKLNAFFDRCEGNAAEASSSSSSSVEVLPSNPPVSMDIECDPSAAVNKDNRNLKYIKPLLGASSRLGRALAELFGLLVKLCVGSPIRQRRGQNIVAAPPMPSLYARNVATALNVLLAEGLDYDKLPACPTVKCRLTFLICSIGFTSPMLFDERRYPYHLMLKKFSSLSGQDIFFKTFKKVVNAGLANLGEGFEYSQLPEGTLGFLDAWLTLLEKMVNPKAILESPHIVSSRGSHNYNFDPLRYLMMTQIAAFEAVMLLWGKNSITSYGARITETLLTVLRHIFRGEKIIKEKYKNEEKNEVGGTSATGSSSSSSFRDIDDNLRQLIDMGFSREHAIEALLHSNTLEQATDYLLSNPPLSRSSNSVTVGLEEDEVQQAIAVSLGCVSSTPEAPKDSLEDDEKSFPDVLDSFTNQALDVCLKLLEILPETVHKVCELLVTIMKRNGRTFRDNLLDTLIGKIKECIESLSSCVFKNDPSLMTYYTITDSQVASCLANYVHLYILFFEVPSYFEMKIPCGYALNRANLLESLINLMVKCINIIIIYDTKHEPKWLAPCFLLLDAVSKVATCTSRKLNMHMSTSRIWRWYDLVTGKWTHYSNINNKLINEAYWNGEQNIRITCGRKRYTVTFANMVQMNDETGNNRPITMTLVTLEHPSCTDINGPDIDEPLYSNLTDSEEQRCIAVPGLSQVQIQEIIKACVKLIHYPMSKNLLHSALQICVRFTRDFEIAKLFVKDGGIRCLLKMRQLSDFGGFGILATILIRHALEEPITLKSAVEKVIRCKTLATIPPPYKDLIYLTRQIGGAVTRDPDAFYEVAINILRVDTSASKGEPAEIILPLKVELPVRAKVSLEDSTVVEVVSDLLDALLKPLDDPSSNTQDDTNNDKDEKSQPKADTVESSVKASSSGEPSTSAEKKAEDQSETKTETPSKKPMLPKSVILKILADAVVSFGPIAKLVTEYKYKAENFDFLTEDISALAFIFDKILPSTEKLSDSDCSTMCKILIAALASSNHSPEAQIALVSEVKVALTRALYLPESSEKHNQVQHICGIISTMIDNCPLPHANRWANGNVNNIVKLMIRRGVFTDLAKITHYLDLSSPHTPFTANAALKPMESLSRTINQPGPSSQNKSRKTQHSNEDNTGAQGDASTEGPNAQGEEIEDAENTEHDISAVTSSLENNSVGTGELDNALEEMMEHILDHRNDNSEGYNDVPSSRANNMDIDEECPIGYDHERDATEELMSTDSGESDSNPSDQVDDEGNDENEDDDNIDDTEENEDNNYDDDGNESRGRRRVSELFEGGTGMVQLATNDRDEDILMIQYNDNALPRMIRWNESGFTLPILDENNPNDHTAITHPLLMSRSNTESSQNSVTRNQRANRARRYQYLFSPRNPNPPVILQRLLGPHDSDMTSVMSANNLLTGPGEMRESTRVVVMDNYGIIPSNEEQIDFVDQSGYLFGPSLAATLSHVPPVLHWWNIESKLLDLESVYDCTTFVCNKLIPSLIKYRNEEIRNKKAKEEEEVSKKGKQAKEKPENHELNQETVLLNYNETNTVATETEPPPVEEPTNKPAEENLDGVPIPPTDVPVEPPPTTRVIESDVEDLEPPGPSTSTDEEIPEGVDPSFLEALPPEMRREVLEQHRILCLQQRIAQRSSNTFSEQELTATTEVSPEFLAALPPALQEEVLTQQRLEQQRQAAAHANPNEPVDAGAFFETLQPSLRTMILSDMEDSQMSALPPDLAAEAQTLRRDWYARNRQMAQERFLQGNLTTIYRQSRGRQSLRHSNFQRGSWGQWSRDFISNSSSANSQVKIRGRQLLDHEGLACLLILLFTDDTNLNKLRLHRVLRNLCYHAPTREWIINALLSIIEKSVRVQPEDQFNRGSRKGPRPGPLTSKLLTDSRHFQNGGHWLTIRMEAALGCAANVFILNKTSGKKYDKSNGANIINIHPQAAPIICRNALDLFTSLAKAFPSCLLPIKSIREESDKNVLTPVKVKSDASSDFWDILLRLDSATKKGKSIQKHTSSSTVSETDTAMTFEQTVFGKLLNLLSSPVVNRNMLLTDNLLRLLSVTTSGMSDFGKPHKGGKGKISVPDIMNKPPVHALNLAVNVITYKNCSEEGLEFITNLLLNLAHTSLDMSFMILSLLLNGAVQIGNIVESQISGMLKDLKDLINSAQKRKLEGGPSTSKGIIYNRFTNEQVVLTASVKVKTACELQLPSMVPLTSKSSSQIFFLRVLRVIVQIRNSIKQSLKKAEGNTYDLLALSEQLDSLNTLWSTLSECLLELEHAPDHHAVLVLQPSVEAFFLVHSPQQGPAKSQKKESEEESEPMQEAPKTEQSGESKPLQGSQSSEKRDHITPDSDKSSDSKPAVPPEQAQFLAFAEKHRTVLNQILRQSTAHLADGPFAVLVDHTRILDFDIKRKYFRTELERMDHGIRREETAVHVRRSNIFEDSFRELFRRPAEEWKNRFYIVFEDEEGQDAGGLLREWYMIISRDIFNPMYALFTVSPGDRVTYMINSASHYNSNHLCYYKFVGRVIAKAIYDNKLLECYFTRSFYKHILGIPVKYTDMESEDYSFYRGLVYLMENNINNLGLDLTFSTEISEFGVTETRDLIPNGRHVPVTEDNKMEYVRLVCQMKMTGAIKQQLNSFLEGFYDIIPKRLISIFNEQELELLISGLPNVDIDDLKANTEYHKYQSNSLQIQWFWRALRSFDQADRAKFLQFVTGTSKVPLQGFGALEGMNGVQKFQIHRDDRSTDRLPSAHTCFNQLDLPVYETYDKLRSYLLKAIHECSEGFGFA